MHSSENCIPVPFKMGTRLQVGELTKFWNPYATLVGNTEMEMKSVPYIIMHTITFC
ncbi:hypothetical protein T4B_14504 [Trichinella pseudospiralis]|uniref:Uncharacterized protein n=1 Tax=Trichinella pseudospiralis TaxID=6337 RepID=A0A0V1GI81_TRIPS|nr:hypothetical protein T4B_14504 [Trichinella pseudospiralis]